MSEPSKYTIHTQSSQIIEHNAGTVIGIQNSSSTDLEVQEAVADLKTLLTQLQTQHSQITSETQALAIIDAEFTEIKQSPTTKLATLRQQILNPERHAQAIKATLGEIAKHYLEDSVWAKATLTYLDKMSESPDQGVIHSLTLEDVQQDIQTLDRVLHDHSL